MGLNDGLAPLISFLESDVVMHNTAHIGGIKRLTCYERTPQIVDSEGSRSRLLIASQYLSHDGPEGCSSWRDGSRR